MASYEIEWISHRGISGQYGDGVVENTLRAFELADADGFDWLETDLRISRDDQLFLQHDTSLMRTAGQQIDAESLNAEALRQVRLEDGRQLAFFDDFVESFPHQNWVLDIKPEQGDRVLALLSARYHDLVSNRLDRIWFQVWKPAHRQYLQAHFPGARLFASMNDCYRTGLRVLTGIPWFGRIQPETLYALTPSFLGIDLYTERMTGPYLENSAQLLAFLPESDRHVAQVLDLPYKFILTNRRRSDFKSETIGDS